MVRAFHRLESRSLPAFSLVELVMVVTIIGIVSAIAVPRMTTASASAGQGALRATLEGVRTAIDMYYAEHSSYPGYRPADGAPDGTEFVKQLTLYSDNLGNTAPTYGTPFLFGPYLRKPFPKNPMNGLDNVHVRATPSSPEPADGSVGWVAVLSHGYFGVSVTDADLGKLGVPIGDEALKNHVRGRAVVGP